MKHLLLAATLSLTASAAFACETVTLGDLSVQHGWSKVTIGTGCQSALNVDPLSAPNIDPLVLSRPGAA